MQVPSVREVGLAQAIPFSPGARWLQALTRTDPKGIHNFGQLPLVRFIVVTPGYLAAMGIPLRAGRAVGARPVDILGMVLRQSFVLVATGIGIGLLASIGLTRVLQGLLFGIKATDSLTFAVVLAILMISALVACLRPAERAANADPVVALRME
jgi:hypothetical protein